MFEEVRGGMMATIKREKFMAIQTKSGDVGNGKDVVDVVIDDVVDKLSERQFVIYKMNTGNYRHHSIRTHHLYRWGILGYSME